MGRCWSAHAFGRVITAYLSGWLVGKAGPRPVFAATATFPLIVCAASCLIRETPSQQGRAAEQHSQGSSSCPPEREQQLLAGAHAESSHGLAETGLDGTTLRPLGSQHSSSLSSQGSAVVLQSQLQLTQGHVHHKSRGSAATQYSDSQHSTPRHAAVGSPAAGLASAAAAEAAENGGVNGGACAAGRSCTSSSGGSKQRQRGCMQQVLINMLTSLKLFWNAIKQPHMLRPVVFLFLLLVRTVLTHSHPANHLHAPGLGLSQPGWACAFVCHTLETQNCVSAAGHVVAMCVGLNRAAPGALLAVNADPESQALWSPFR